MGTSIILMGQESGWEPALELSTMTNSTMLIMISMRLNMFHQPTNKCNLCLERINEDYSMVKDVNSRILMIHGK